MFAANDQNPVSLLAFVGEGEAKDNIGFQALGQVFAAVAALPEIAKLLRQQQEQILALQRELREAQGNTDPDGWMDTKQARAYLAGMSPSTFDKYSTQTVVKIKGYKLDGKILHKRSDLDNFVRLYAVNSRRAA